MPLTPIDVQQKTFGTALRGYDLDEVDDFLDDVVTSLKDYEQRLRDAQERIATLEMEMADRGDAEGAIARALVSAQRSADAIVEDARTQADKILEDAQSEASELTRLRDDEKAEAEREIQRIRTVIVELQGRVRELVGTLGGTLEEAEGSLDHATGRLDGEMALQYAAEEKGEDEALPSWAQPSRVGAHETYGSEDDSEGGEDESPDASPYAVADTGDEREDEDEDDDDDQDEMIVEDVEPTVSSEWAHGDADHPVRPWEV